ncbi:thiamin pyrophosphokinase 1-like [Ruditapes philippinarum]|uniref:thiamin pyrophosphokinase 1-like n=1 Tax=Ruditapes philippinarum TaxID=129788 RepID=UPI00295B5B93|nr:thiamin pyrophosphokinase 1-like [Ruditapes philippinarum]
MKSLHLFSFFSYLEHGHGVQRRICGPSLLIQIMETLEWELLHILKSDNCSKFALLILNQPLEPELEIFHKLWSKAVYKACVDGGTNELYDTLGEQRGEHVPDIITGDFDSARADVLQFYKDKGVEIINTPDQDDTDFTKCLKLILERRKMHQIECVIALSAFGGRLDQQFANINTLFTASQLAGSVPVYLLSSQSMTCLLQKGCHRLKVNSGYEGDSCGLVPIAGKCNCISTTGLKWNLDKQAMSFGELISTSNTWNGDSDVTVETDNSLLWMMNVKLQKDECMPLSEYNNWS